MLALDFAGDLADVVSQPLLLRFTVLSGQYGEHAPDVLAVTRSGTWLIDVRPESRIGDKDAESFAAAAEAAPACGWGCRARGRRVAGRGQPCRRTR